MVYELIYHNLQIWYKCTRVSFRSAKVWWDLCNLSEEPFHHVMYSTWLGSQTSQFLHWDTYNKLDILYSIHSWYNPMFNRQGWRSSSWHKTESCQWLWFMGSWRTMGWQVIVHFINIKFRNHVAHTVHQEFELKQSLQQGKIRGLNLCLHFIQLIVVPRLYQALILNI